MLSCLTEFSEELYKKGLLEEGREEGRELEAIQNAKNFFENGADYELVRKSITYLTDEQLKKIYEEVMDLKNE